MMKKFISSYRVILPILFRLCRMSQGSIYSFPIGKRDELEVSWALSAQVRILSTTGTTSNKVSAIDGDFFFSCIKQDFKMSFFLIVNFMFNRCENILQWSLAQKYMSTLHENVLSLLMTESQFRFQISKVFFTLPTD